MSARPGRRHRVVGSVAALVVAAALGAAAPGGPSAEAARWRAPTFERSISGTGLAPLYAWGVQYNPVTDEVLVGDYFNYVVRRFDTEGNLLARSAAVPARVAGSPTRSPSTPGTGASTSPS
jgi:hypothetical protein